jgi:hypothetical protein
MYFSRHLPQSQPYLDNCQSTANSLPSSLFYACHHHESGLGEWPTRILNSHFGLEAKNSEGVSGINQNFFPLGAAVTRMHEPLLSLKTNVQDFNYVSELHRP